MLSQFSCGRETGTSAIWKWHVCIVPPLTVHAEFCLFLSNFCWYFQNMHLCFRIKLSLLFACLHDSCRRNLFLHKYQLPLLGILQSKQPFLDVHEIWHSFICRLPCQFLVISNCLQSGGTAWCWSLGSTVGLNYCSTATRKPKSVMKRIQAEAASEFLASS